MSEYKRKLIEVAMPLEAINAESKRDKVLSSGHPTTLHYWWAPRPLPACRAVVFASLVDDPSAHPEDFPDAESQERERTRLFGLIERLILWESRRDRHVLEEARAEIEKSVGPNQPTLLDPFCGRGLIPLEGQRLGLDVVASDLNPVAVTIAKTLLEAIPSAIGLPPVHPESQKQDRVGGWEGLAGLLADLDHYTARVLEVAEPALKDHFPEYVISEELTRKRPDLDQLKGKSLPVMGYLWARTARCVNPTCGFALPLVGSLWLSKKTTRTKYWLEPSPNPSTKRIEFDIRSGDGEAPAPTKIPRTSGSFRCPACGEVSDDKYIAKLGEAGEIGQQLLACIADGGRSVGRVYLPPTKAQEEAAEAAPEWRPEMPIPDYGQAMPQARHGVTTWADLFTERQLTALNTFSDAIGKVRTEAAAAMGEARSEGGLWGDRDETESERYLHAISLFLGLVLGKYVNRSCNFCFWHAGRENIEQPFAHQGIQKTWDFVETNPFSGASGSWYSAREYPMRVVREVYTDVKPATVLQKSADSLTSLGGDFLVVTDPPYYDNVGYADLSDFFYIWLRKALQDVEPDLFRTVLTPKAEEIAAVRHRFDGDRRAAEEFFIDSFERAARELARSQSDDYPLCLFYAYKQQERPSGEVEYSTGWETMLRGMLEADLMIVGTWPFLSESIDTIKKGKSSLSTSVVLVCRKRPADAALSTRRQFIADLKRELPEALRLMQQGNIAPVDLAQAAIGPGMAAFSRHARVLESDGTTMSVRTALQLINQTLDEVLGEQEGDFDADTRWAIAWFDQYGLEEGPFGRADVLARAKVTSVSGLEAAGLARRVNGNVRLVRRTELDGDWDPTSDDRLTIWEATQHLIRRLENDGEVSAAELLRQLGSVGDSARDLAYRLFSTAERKGWNKEALAYNGLVVAWPEVSRLAEQLTAPEQTELL